MRMNMNMKNLLQLVSFFSIIALLYATESAGHDIGNVQTYNLHSLFKKTLTHIQSSRNLKHESPEVMVNLQPGGFDPNVLLQQYGNSSTNTSKCVSDVLYIFQNIKSQWAMKVIDSFGKPESGILEGNLKWLGDYNECIQVQSTNPNSTDGNFRGRYCSLSFSVPLFNATLPFVIGVCVPDSCSTEELQSLLQFSRTAGVDLSLKGAESSSLSASITCRATERPLNAPAIAIIVLLSMFFTLAVVGSTVTAVKYFKKVFMETKGLSLIINAPESDHVVENGNAKRSNSATDGESTAQDHLPTEQNDGDGLSKLETFLSCFCVFTNGAKVLNTDSSEGQLLCIHGIRFLSMSWVILGHVYAFCFQNIRNMTDALRLIDNFAFEVVLQGFYSVDSFFVLSGFLLTYLSMKEFAKTKGSINWPYFYLHRYIRLTPIYMIVLGFSASLYFYLGSGPLWPDNTVDPLCKDNWWRNLIYINNFGKMSDQCMGWSWYLANDMQFFIISPLFLVTLWRWPKIGYGLLVTALLSCWISNFVITYHYDLSAGLTTMVSNPKGFDMITAMQGVMSYMNKIYIKPYTRIAPYLIGMFTGYLLFRHNASNKPKYSWFALTVGWTFATTITLACVYGMYHQQPDKLGSSFYNALHRTTWAIGLCWVIYVCLRGQGGFVDSILSYKFFIPLSRLTYTAYLIHPLIITGYFASLNTPLQFSHPTMVFLFLGTMVVTYALALPVSLILESPVVSLEKFLRKSLTKKEGS